MEFILDGVTGAQGEGDGPVKKVFAGKLYLAASGTFASIVVKYKPTNNQNSVDLATINAAGVTVVDVPSGLIEATVDGTAADAYLGIEQ